MDSGDPGRADRLGGVPRRLRRHRRLARGGVLVGDGRRLPGRHRAAVDDRPTPRRGSASASDTIFLAGGAGAEGPQGPDGRLGGAWSTPCTGRHGMVWGDHDSCVAGYDAHNAAVRRAASRWSSGSPATGGGRWPTPSASPVPDEPFPHANTTDEFRTNFEARCSRVTPSTGWPGPPPGPRPGAVVRASSPQGRFAEGAARLDAGRVARRFEAGQARVRAASPAATVLHVHLGLIGEVAHAVGRDGPPPPIGEIRLRLEGETHAWDLSGPCHLRRDHPFERRRPGRQAGPRRRCDLDADVGRFVTKVQRSNSPIGGCCSTRR